MGDSGFHLISGFLEGIAMKRHWLKESYKFIFDSDIKSNVFFVCLNNFANYKNLEGEITDESMANYVMEIVNHEIEKSGIYLNDRFTVKFFNSKNITTHSHYITFKPKEII